MGSPVGDRAHVSSGLDVARARLRSRLPSGQGRGLRCGALVRSAEAAGAVRQIRSCRLATGLATGSVLDPGPRSSMMKHVLYRQPGYPFTLGISVEYALS